MNIKKFSLIGIFLLILFLPQMVFSDTGTKSSTGTTISDNNGNQGSDSSNSCPYSSWGDSIGENLGYFFCGVKSTVQNKQLMDGIGIIALFLGTFSLMFFLLNKRIIKDQKVSKVLALMISFFSTSAAVMLVKDNYIVLYFGGWLLLLFSFLISIGLFIMVLKWANLNYGGDENKIKRYVAYISAILLITSLFLDVIAYINKEAGIDSSIIAGFKFTLDYFFVFVLIALIVTFIMGVGKGSNSENSSTGISKIVDKDKKKIDSYKSALKGVSNQLTQLNNIHNEERDNLRGLLSELSKLGGSS